MFDKLCYGGDNGCISVNDKKHNDGDNESITSVMNLNKKKNL